MQTPTWHPFLILLWLLIPAGGCQSGKRAVWCPPAVAIPQQPSGLSQGWALAEAAYAQAVELENCDDATCVDYYFQTATLTWSQLAQQISEAGVSDGRTTDLYRSSLTKLIRCGQRFGRLDPRRGLQIWSDTERFTVPTRYHGFPWRPDDFDGLVPVGEYSTEELNSAYCNAGLGVATVAVHVGKSDEPFRRSPENFAATAVLRPVGDLPSSACPFVLELFDPLRISAITISGRQVPLERDLSAPIVYVLSQADRDYLRGFLQPGSTTDNAGLFMLEPYQPGKIPLVFVHGLLSDRLTWANLANEIRAQPDLLDRYQIWGFEYATGGPFLSSAATLRRQLGDAHLRLDPTGADAALSQMVLVGHSMGGLICKLQITQSGTRLWDAVSCRPFEQIITTPETHRELAASFFFDPAPFVSRVVFIGTPHRGSPWAGRPIGRLGSKLVDEPTFMEEQHRQLTRDNGDVFSREFTRGLPTSIDLLEPESPLLQAMDRLPRDPHVQWHSIVGSSFWMIGAGDSDKVVPVDSARTPGVVSERRVDAQHVDLNKNSASIAELLCILRRHLVEYDRGFGP